MHCYLDELLAAGIGRNLLQAIDDLLPGSGNQIMIKDMKKKICYSHFNLSFALGFCTLVTNLVISELKIIFFHPDSGFSLVV